MYALEVRNLIKDYGKRRALKGISFTVEEGEIFGLIGPNGAGKTTTLRIVSTLLQITSGTVTIFGHDLSKEASKIRKMISYLPEEAGAYKNPWNSWHDSLAMRNRSKKWLEKVWK